MASFRQYYGLDFMDALYRTHSPRELMALITWLPDDSPLAASLRGGRDHLGWTWDRILSLFILEQLQMNGFNFIKANTGKASAKTLKAPDPIPFPGRVMPKPKTNRASIMPMVRLLSTGNLPPEIK